MRGGSVLDRIAALKRGAVRREGTVRMCSAGAARCFRAYDRGGDTFVFEDGVFGKGKERASVLVVPRTALSPGGRGGFVLTLTTGNHAVAALPLLGGKFWDLADVAPSRRSETMRRDVLCANVVCGRLELSQRDVPLATLVACDCWLTGTLGFPLADVVLAERKPGTLARYRRCGQEWRVRPPACTVREMSAAVAASRKRIASGIVYFHNVRGVHFLSYPEFHRFAATAGTDPAAFRAGLRELAGVFEGQNASFLRQPKYRRHHEIELFGLVPGAAERIIPELERILADDTRRAVPPAVLRRRIASADHLFKSLLERPSLANAASPDFTETLYTHIAGEIYYQ